MPIPSEKIPSTDPRQPVEDWAARPERTPRSLFGNYRAESETGGAVAMADAAAEGGPELAARRIDGGSLTGAGLQAAINLAMARSFVYRFTAQAYEDPTAGGWARLCTPENQHTLLTSMRVLAPSRPQLAVAVTGLLAWLKPDGFEPFLESYLAAFGHAARGRCPMNEIEYGDLKADPLFQPHRLADLSAFYRAFGLELTEDANERQDHLCLELEFMCVLTAKEAYGLEHQHDQEDLALCREAQKRFLREHLGRWTPAFSRRLARMADANALGALAEFTRVFIESECARLGILAGSEDLLLRPVDEAAESLCGSCGAGEQTQGAK
jgi:putative dimethyl sulfoxide reductase chaperone